MHDCRKLANNELHNESEAGAEGHKSSGLSGKIPIQQIQIAHTVIKMVIGNGTTKKWARKWNVESTKSNSAILFAYFVLNGSACATFKTTTQVW